MPDLLSSANHAPAVHVVHSSMGSMGNMSWYLEINGSHFGFLPRSIHRMSGLGGSFVLTMTYLHRPQREVGHREC